MFAIARRILSLSAAGWLAVACRAPGPPPVANRGAVGEPTRVVTEPELSWEPLLSADGTAEAPIELRLCGDDDCQVVASFSTGERIAMTQRSPSRRHIVVIHRPVSGPWSLTAFAAPGGGPRWSRRLDGFDGPSGKTYRWLADDGLLITWSAGTGVESGIAVRAGHVVADLSATGHEVSSDGEFIAVLTAGTPATAVELLDARTGGLVAATTVAGYPRLSWRQRELIVDTDRARTTVRLPR